MSEITKLYDPDLKLPEFKEIKPVELNENAVKLIGYDWMLITAGKEYDHNTMTASWGGIGMLWNKPVVYIFIRPQRCTYDFVERENFFTCSFFDEKYRDKLSFCGTYSGRDCVKYEEVNFSPVSTFHNSVAFREARIIIECRKIYFQDLDPSNFLLSSINKHYPENDFHRMYIGEITSVLIKKEDKE